jgi:beta-aspartyl-peptidase (threonine type)
MPWRQGGFQSARRRARKVFSRALHPLTTAAATTGSGGSRVSSLPALVVHGGAWAIPEASTAATLAGVRDATTAGWGVLQRGGAALDAVEAAVRVLEDDPAFDAGRGSVLTEEGRVEMDAVVMDGRTLDSGAVACITTARNPVTVARAVMEQTDHCLVVGPGADRLVGQLQGCEAALPGYLITEAARAEYEHFKSYSKTVNTLFRAQGTGPPRSAGADNGAGHDTVGAVAVDLGGNVASATSTGGITYGMPGRVGDSPLVGLGCLADNSLGAISATGHGESIMRMCLGSRILLGAAEIGRSHPPLVSSVSTALGGVVNLWRCCLWCWWADPSGSDPSRLSTAAASTLRAMQDRVGGQGGIIAVLADGTIAVDFTTERMAWGMACPANHAALSLSLPMSGQDDATAIDGSEPLEGGGLMLVGIDHKPAGCV